MGFFSWLCAKSNKPVLHSSGDWYGREFSKVVVVTPKSVAYGEYDGYGTVLTDMGELEVLESVESGTAKLVLERFYNGEKFAQLPVCKSDPGQGHFYSMDDLAKIFGPLPADEQAKYDAELEKERQHKAFLDEVRAKAPLLGFTLREQPKDMISRYAELGYEGAIVIVENRIADENCIFGDEAVERQALRKLKELLDVVGGK
jgi:hypothetical protein